MRYLLFRIFLARFLRFTLLCFLPFLGLCNRTFGLRTLRGFAFGVSVSGAAGIAAIGLYGMLDSSGLSHSLVHSSAFCVRLGLSLPARHSYQMRHRNLYESVTLYLRACWPFK